jgi:hypothetical protein
MDKNLSTHIGHLKAFNNQRKGWLFFSLLISLIVGVISFNWNTMTHSTVAIWFVVSSGLITAVGWWYWTMRLIYLLIQYRIEESLILKDLITDIKSIKDDVQNLKK